MNWRMRLGTWWHERWKSELVLNMPRWAERCGVGWVDLCNRRERLEASPDGRGRRCLWNDSSPLTVCREFPQVGGRLLQHCLRQWPIEFTDTVGEASSSPEVSFIVPIGGAERLPQLGLCLASVAAQQDCSIELLVAEQGDVPRANREAPARAEYMLVEPKGQDAGFNKSRLMNAAARVARGKVLVFLDGDLLVPTRFAQTARDLLASDFDVAQLHRLVFYLLREDTEESIAARLLTGERGIANVVQNTPGGTTAIRRDAYFRIGGHDESFVGWGGEDNEFRDRWAALREYPGGFIPLVHLWHPAAPNKSGERNHSLLAQRRAIPVERRIEELVARESRQATTPSSVDLPAVVQSSNSPARCTSWH